MRRSYLVAGEPVSFDAPFIGRSWDRRCRTRSASAAGAQPRCTLRAGRRVARRAPGNAGAPYVLRAKHQRQQGRRQNEGELGDRHDGKTVESANRGDHDSQSRARGLCHIYDFCRGPSRHHQTRSKLHSPLYFKGWVVAVATLSAWRRRRRGLPVFRPRLAGTLFEDQWCSGGRGLLWARNCAWICLLPQKLVTGLHFPFQLFFPSRLLAWAGLDNEIDVRDIVSTDKERNFGSECVRISYRTTTGTESFQMCVARPDTMLRLLDDAQRQARGAA